MLCVRPPVVFDAMAEVETFTLIPTSIQHFTARESRRQARRNAQVRGRSFMCVLIQ